MEIFIDKVQAFLLAKLLSIIEPYKGSNIILQLVVLVILTIGTFFLNRFINHVIKKNDYRIKKSQSGLLIYDAIYPVFKMLTLAIVLSFTTEVFQYSKIAFPIIEQIYIILYLWVAIKIVSRIIVNKAFKKIIIYSAWVIIILNVLNIYSDAAILLDSISVTISGFRISIYGILRSIVFFGVIFKVATLLIAFAHQRIEVSEDLNPTIKVLMLKLINALIFVFATILFINVLRIDLGSLALFTSALGVGIGFGLQKIVANLISGVTLLLDKSLKPGDIIEVADQFGTVKVMGARYTSIVTIEGKEHLVPNEHFITNEVVNWSHSNKLVRQYVEVGVSYDADIHQVMAILEDAAKKVERVLKRPKTVIQLLEFGDSSINFRIQFWINDPQKGVLNVKSDLLIEIWNEFKANNIEIPFPQRDLHIKNFPQKDLTS